MIDRIELAMFDKIYEIWHFNDGHSVIFQNDMNSCYESVKIRYVG